MGRKRNKRNQWRPPYVKTHKGRYIYTPYLGCENGRPKFGKEIVLGPDTLSQVEVWQRYGEVTGATTNLTIKTLCDKYFKSPDFQALAPRTQADYQRYYNIIVFKPIAAGLFGDTLAEKVTPGIIRQYLDKRATEGAPVGANKEIGFLSAAYSWAFNRDLVPVNPCIGVKRNPRHKRQHYVNDADYMPVLRMAGPAYVPLVMELCYLCRLRENEALKLTWAAVSDGVLTVKRGKGSKDSRIPITARLQSVLDRCWALPLKITPLRQETRPLVHNAQGQPITIAALQSAWKRRQKLHQKRGGVPFWLHDLKRKGVSDFEGDKLKASGHRDPKMLEIYDVLPDTVDPTRSDNVEY